MPFEFSLQALPSCFDRPYGRVFIGTHEIDTCKHCNIWLGPVVPADDTYVPGQDCRCLDCLAHFRPATHFDSDDPLKQVAVSDEAARELAGDLARGIQADRAHVKERLGRFGNTIMTKWKKMPEQKRVQIVLAAEPDLYKEKWPESRMMFGLDHPDTPPGGATHNPHPDHGNRPEWFSRRQRMAHLLPNLNVETLVADPMKFLGLLHHRAQSSPEEWVAFDIDQMKLGWNFGCLMNTYNGNCVIMHGEEFEKLVPWEKDSRHTMLRIGFPRAKLVLEAQSTLFQFLRKVVDQLVQPGRNQEGSDKWLAMISSGFKAPGQVVNWSVFTNQPFSAPPAFDPYESLEQAKAQLAACQDHLHFLQTEPLYLQQELRYKWSRALEGTRWENRLDLLLREVISIPIKDVQRQTAMVDQCEHIVKLYEQHKDSIRAFSPLPDSYEIALGGLEYLCYRDLHNDADCTKWLLAMSPGFSQYWRQKTADEGVPGWILNDDMEEGSHRRASKYKRDPLLWGVLELLLPPSNLNIATRSRVMAEISSQLTASKQSDRLDQAVYYRLSRIETELSMMDAIRQHRPSIEYFRTAMLTPEENEKFGDRFGDTKLFGITCCEEREIKELLYKFLSVPCPTGKRDQQWLRAETDVRGIQADIWESARDVFKRRLTAAGLLPDKIEREVQIVFGDIRGKHEAFLNNQEHKIGRKLAERQKKSIFPAEVSMQTQWGSYEAPKVAMPAEKVKPKTKGEACPLQSEQTTANANVESQETPRHTIAVNRYSLRVFAKMLSSRLEDDDRGEIAWDNFVAAMVDAGFSATHTGGSEVTFKPDTEATGAKGRIVFHKPHPTSQIGSIMLSSMGRRLRKWFGWDVDTFVERKK